LRPRRYAKVILAHVMATTEEDDNYGEVARGGGNGEQGDLSHAPQQKCLEFGRHVAPPSPLLVPGENKSFAIRKQLLTTVFDLPIRVVNAFPRPLRDAVNKLKQPFRDGILDIYSHRVYELVEAYEAYNNEKLERQRRAEKRSLLVLETIQLKYEAELASR